MAVNLTNAEIRQFELAGITREMIGRTIERDRAAGLPDNEIELRAAAKAENLEKANPSFTTGRGVSRAITNLHFCDTINRGIQGIKAVYDATLDKITGNDKPTLRQYLEAPEGVEPADRSWSEMVSDEYNQNMKKLDRTIKELNYDVPGWYKGTMDVAGTIGSYGLMPVKSVPAEMAIYGADAFQAGYNKDLKDRAINGALGAGIVGALGGAGAVGNKIRVARQAAQDKHATKVIKENVSETLGKVLEKPRSEVKNGEIVVNWDHQDNILGQMINSGPKTNGVPQKLTYSEQETLIRKMPKVVKADKQTGKVLKKAAEENMNKNYLNVVTDNLDSEANMLLKSPGVSAEAKQEAEQMLKISNILKDKKNINEIDDLFTKGVTDAEEGLSSLNTDKVIDYLDDFITKLDKSNVITKGAKDRIKNNMFNSGMERRLAKRIHYIDEADMAKHVGGSWLGDKAIATAKDIGSGALWAGVDLMLGGTGVTGGLLGALGREGVGFLSGRSAALVKKRAQQRAVQNSLKKIETRAELNKAYKDALKTGNTSKVEKLIVKEHPELVTPSFMNALTPLTTTQKMGVVLLNQEDEKPALIKYLK